ncbi:MAG: hypothetical protein P8Z75_10575 [Gammaproteobacteria bacterium]|jgi:hypothetical protein
MRKLIGLILLFSLSFARMALADQVKIVHVMIEPDANRWTFHVTLQHHDTGWKHYADDWRIVDDKGKVLGDRKLWHPHVGEKTFTRSLASVLIPRGTHVVYVEAHDKVHGWSKQRVRIDMRVARGSRYRIRRP